MNYSESEQEWSLQDHLIHIHQQLDLRSDVPWPSLEFVMRAARESERAWEFGLRKPFDAMPRIFGDESMIRGLGEVHGGEIFKRSVPGPWKSVGRVEIGVPSDGADNS